MKPYPQRYYNFPLGSSNAYFFAFLNSVEKRMGTLLVLKGTNAKPGFEYLIKQKDEIEKELGCQLDWSENPGKVESHIRMQILGPDLFDVAKWPEFFEWLANAVESYDRVFRPQIELMKANGIL